MTREPLEQSGNGSAGIWKLNAKGFCTAWNHVKPNCFTVVPSGENKWSVQKIATTITQECAPSRLVEMAGLFLHQAPMIAPVDCGEARAHIFDWIRPDQWALYACSGQLEIAAIIY